MAEIMSPEFWTGLITFFLLLTIGYACVWRKGVLDWGPAVRRRRFRQLDHLRRQACVVPRLAEGRLQVHGWVYDLETGRASVHDPGTGEGIRLGTVEVAPGDVDAAGGRLDLAGDDLQGR